MIRRRLLLVAGWALAGCGASSRVPVDQAMELPDLARGADLSRADLARPTDLAAADLAMAPPDLALGGLGAACKTACDCQPGLACLVGKCANGKAPVYCCPEKPCPQGEMCEAPDGTAGKCGGARDGGLPGLELGLPGLELGLPGLEFGLPGLELGLPGFDLGLPTPDFGNIDVCGMIDCSAFDVCAQIPGCKLCVATPKGKRCSR